LGTYLKAVIPKIIPNIDFCFGKDYITRIGALPTDTPKEGIGAAEKSIDSGAAREKLTNFAIQKPKIKEIPKNDNSQPHLRRDIQAVIGK